MRESTIRLSPAERRNDVAAQVAAQCATGAQYRRALEILAINWELRRALLAACFVVAVVAVATAAASGIDLLFGCAAAALGVALIIWRLWFDVRGA